MLEMLKPLLTFAGLATMGAAPALADQNPVSPAFGNTILSTYPDGRTAELRLKQVHPFAPPISFRTPIPSSGFSAAWSAKAVSGEPIKITLVKGRATGAPVTQIR